MARDLRSSERHEPFGGGGSVRWPPWFAPAGLLVALGTGVTISALIAAVAAELGTDATTPPPELTLFATVTQDLLLVLTAVALAATVAHPSPGDFGLRSAPVRGSVLATSIAAGGYVVTSSLYAALLGPPGDQGLADDLGVHEGIRQLLAAAAVVIVVAPFAEEVFFRGFMYRALRNRLRVGPAAVIAALVFGSLHYRGPDSVPLLPLLALLGLVFCLLYESIRTLYPVIALHAANNGLALGIAGSGLLPAVIATVFGGAMIVACLRGVMGGVRLGAP